MSRNLYKATLAALIATVCSLNGEDAKNTATKTAVKDSPATKNTPVKAVSEVKAFKAFTGKVSRSHVRMRLLADLESQVISELNKGDYIIVTGEKGDFFAIEPNPSFKAYIFRSFVLDNVVEGNHVNVRLSPELEAPVIAHLDSGYRIEGKICEKNPKWLEITPPKGVCFYIAKEYVENVGDPSVKTTRDSRLAEVSRLFESAQFLTQSEMLKPFEEIDFSKITRSYTRIVEEFKDFPEFAEKSQTKLYDLQETYLKKKIAYLESRASQLSTGHMLAKNETPTNSPIRTEAMSATERMKIWFPVEEALYLTWSMRHHAKTIDDFYEEQKLQAITLCGTLDSFVEPIKNKPGEYILKNKEVPIAYLYSTTVNLAPFIGKNIQILASPRTNNHFAFPAFYVLNAE